MVGHRPDLYIPFGRTRRPDLPPGRMTLPQIGGRHHVAEMIQTEMLAAALDVNIFDIGHLGYIRYRRPPVVVSVGGITGGDVIIDIDGAFIDSGDILRRNQHAGIGVRVRRRVGLAPT